jgi:hypothetical protein
MDDVWDGSALWLIESEYDRSSDEDTRAWEYARDWKLEGVFFDCE